MERDEGEEKSMTTSVNVDHIVSAVIHEIREKLFVEVEASGRHVHLSQHDLETLFGVGYQLTPVKDLSQPGQYACKERVTITGPKGSIKNVIILGPVRKESQVEISLTDALTLGIKAPIRNSGDISGTPGITICNEGKCLDLNEGVIVARRHLHITPQDARKFDVSDGDIIKVKVFGERPLIFDDVIVRVSDKFHTDVHIDYDEANACGFTKGTKGLIVK